MNNKTVILNPDQWMACWRVMCRELEHIPAWCDYPKYFKCISCSSTNYQIHGHSEGLKIVFAKAKDAMTFKLKYGTQENIYETANITPIIYLDDYINRINNHDHD